MIDRLPRSLKFLLLWLLGFALLLMLMEWERLHTVDAKLAAWLQGSEVHLSDQVVLVDVPITKRDANDDCPDDRFRRHVGELLTLLAADNTARARSIALDIAFSAECSPEDPKVAEEVNAVLAAGVQALTHKNVGVPVFGVQGVDSIDKQPVARPQGMRIKAIYDSMDFTGHTWFLQADDVTGLWPAFPPCLWVEVPGSSAREQDEHVLLMGLPLLVTGSNHICVKPLRGEEMELWRVPVGGALTRVAPSQLLHFEPDAAACASRWRDAAGKCLSTPPVLKDKQVVVGNLEIDTPYKKVGGPYRDVSGPELVAWAISDLLLRGEEVRARILINMPGLHMGLALATALLGWGLFIVLQRFFPRLRLAVWRLALLAALLAMLLPLFLIGLARVFQHDYSQVLLPILTTALTLALAAWHRTKALADVAQRKLGMVDPDAAAYDIFVSYRHSHTEWVVGTLKPLLAGLRRRDGSRLNVFYDDKGIYASQNWGPRLGQVIHHSRIFLAVLTPDYFTPNEQGVSICTWEMEQALQRNAENTMSIVPVFHAGYDPANKALIPPRLAALGSIQGPFSHSDELAQQLSTPIFAALDKD